MIIERFTLGNLDFWTSDRDVHKRVENPWLRKIISFSEEFFDCFSSNICEQKFNCHGNRITVVRRKRENERAGWFITTLKVLSFLIGFGFLVLGIKLAYRRTFKIQSPIEDKLFQFEQAIIREKEQAVAAIEAMRAQKRMEDELARLEIEAINEKARLEIEALQREMEAATKQARQGRIEAINEKARLEMKAVQREMEAVTKQARQKRKVLEQQIIIEREALEQQMKAIQQETRSSSFQIINHTYSETILELKQKIKGLYEIIDALKSEVEQLNERLASNFKPDEIVRVFNEKILCFHQEVERLNNSIKSDSPSDEKIRTLHEEIQKLNQGIVIFSERFEATLKPRERVLLQENQRLKQKIEKLKTEGSERVAAMAREIAMTRNEAEERMAAMARAMEMANQAQRESIAKIQEEVAMTQKMAGVKIATTEEKLKIMSIIETTEDIRSRTRIVSPTKTDVSRSSPATSDVASSSCSQQEDACDRVPSDSIKEME